MTRKLFSATIISFSVLTLSLVGCGKHAHDEHADEAAHAGHADEIIFPKEKAEAAGLKTETIQPGDFRQVIKTSGQILSAQGDEVTVVATANGVVSLTNAVVSDGTPVKGGEVLMRISAKNLADGDPTAKLRFEYEAAKKEFVRAENLVKDRIISAKEFEQAKLRYETAKNAYEALAGKVTTQGVAITAPISGFLKNRLVNQGDYVSVGQPLATISQNKRLQLRAEVSERYFKDLSGITSANFKVPYDQKLYQLDELNGRLLSFGKSSAQNSFYLPVTFEFDNIGEIVPGSFTEVYLLSGIRNNVLSVPVSALTEEQGLFFVYLRLDDEGYKKQEVTTGQTNGDRIQILSGVKPGDQVVVKGAYQVKLAATSSVVPEGHSH